MGAASSSSSRRINRITLSDTSPEDTRDLTDVNTNRRVSSSSTSSRMVRVCTMCGRYKGFRMRRYLFILLCVALLLVILLLGAVVLLYGVVPVVVRSTIAKAQIGFRSVNIEQIQSDRFRLKADLALSNTGSIPAIIDAPFIIHVDDVGVVTNSDPITISGGSGNETIVPIDAPFVISNMDAFNNFTRSLIFQSDVTWHFNAQATIRPLSKHMIAYRNIPFNKEIQLKAFNGLHNASIDSISLNRSDAQRIIVDAIIKIQNPSVFGMELGRLLFTLQYNNISIGYVQSSTDNTTLHPGENAVAFIGELQSPSNESYNAITVIIKNFLTNQTTHVSALAGPNCTSYPLFARGMTGLVLGVDMPAFEQDLIASLAFDSLSLVPSTTDKTVIFSAQATITVNSPLGINSPLDLRTIDMTVSLVYQNNDVGLLTIVQAPVNRSDPITYHTEFNNKTLMLNGSGANYEKFAQDFLNANKSNPITFRVAGLTSVIGSFALGPLNVSGIHVQNDVKLVGLNGLSDVQVHGIAVNGEEETALRLAINVTIGNSGIANVQLQNFTLYVADVNTSTVLGYIPIDILAVHPGSNNFSFQGFIAPLHEEDLPIVGQFFSAYLNNQTQGVKLFHDTIPAENATAMDLTISGLSMKSNIDGIKADLIREVNVLNFGIEFDRDDVNRVFVTGSLSVSFQLPSNVNMTFKALSTSINFVMRSNGGPALGQMILKDLPVQHNQTTNEILASFEKQELFVLDKTAFEEFTATLLLKPNATVSIEGLVSAVTLLRIGNITLTDIPLNHTIVLPGFNQFDGGLLRINDTDIIGSISPRALALRVKTEITNPSIVNIIYGGRLQLNLCDIIQGLSLGEVNIDPFFLEPKENITRVESEGIFNLTDSNVAVAKTFISNMVSGIDSEVELRGILDDNSTGTNIPLFSLAVAGLHARTIVPGLTGEKLLVREFLVKRLTAAEIAGITIGLVKHLSVRIRAFNPFSTPIVINGVKAKADYGPKIDDALQVGLVDDHTIIQVGPHQEIISPYVNVTIAAKLTTLAIMIGPLLSGHAHLSLTGTIDVIIGDDFVFKEVPLTALNVTAQQEHDYNV